MGEVVLDGAVVLGPVQPIHPELRAVKMLLGLSGIGETEHDQGRVAKEDEPPSGSQ